MKKVFTVLIGLLIVFQVSATGGKGKGHGKGASCDSDSYSSEIVSREKISESCVKYQVKVSYDGTKTYGLSHYSISIPCGQIKDARNSKKWKMSLEKDRKKGWYVLKVDDIRGFGERGKDSFIVSFTLCSGGQCKNDLGVATYKAGKCVDYDTLSNPGTPDPGPGQTCSSLLATLEKKDATCAGQRDGELKVIVTEGEGPYTYAWSNGSRTDVAADLPAGSYGVTVKDTKGNVLTLQGEITAPPAIVITEHIINPTCSGQNTGAVELEVSGGTGSLSFTWNTGQTSQNVSNLPGGFYSVTVTDSLGCSATKAMMLTNGTLVSAEATVRNPTCTQNNGSIDVTPVGGVAPYTYQWSNGATTQDLQNLAAGSYLVTITDSGGCLTHKIYTLETISPVLIQYVVKPASCEGDNSGAIDLTISGGTAPYDIKWLDGPTTEDRTGLAVGGYQVSVTDAAGCTAQSFVFVNNKTLQVNSEINQPNCAGDAGSITIVPTDGTGPYTYEWSNGQTGSTIGGLEPGNYQVTIRDASGCSQFQSFFIIAPGAISASGVISNTQCGAAGSYAIDLSVLGGKWPYSYQWSTGATSEDVSGLNAGTYFVDVKDGAGCAVRKEFVIDAAGLSWSCLINPVSSVVCGSVGNALSTDVTGAASYQWTITSTDNSWLITSGSTEAVVVYTAGHPGSTATFTLTVEKNGCTQTCSYTVTGGCEVRDNNGGGDPGSNEPCVGTPATPPVVVVPEPEPETPAPGDDRHGCKPGVAISAYPNPFHDRVKLEWTASANERVKLEIYDMRGNRVCVLHDGIVSAGQRYSFDWSTTGCRDSYYYFRYTSSKTVSHGKLVRKR